MDLLVCRLLLLFVLLGYGKQVDLPVSSESSECGLASPGQLEAGQAGPSGGVDTKSQMKELGTTQIGYHLAGPGFLFSETYEDNVAHHCHIPFVRT